MKTKAPMFAVTLILLACSLQVKATLTSTPTVICPDDTVSFTCALFGSIIRWTVTSPQPQVQAFDITLTISNTEDIRGNPAFRGVLTDTSEGMVTATLTSLSEASTVEGYMVECTGSLGSQEGPLTITVADLPSPPLNPKVSSIQNQPSSSNITLEWNSSSSTGGVSVLSISPAPLSGSPVTVETTSTQITISYNTPYNVTIKSVNCVGMSESSILFTIPSIVSCLSSFSVASGVVNIQIPNVPPTGNSTLTFTCSGGDQMVTSTCGSNGQWNPDPENFMCPTMEPPVICTTPTIDTGSQSYTEGSQVTYQCNDGLFPMGFLTATCTKDLVWEPDPRAVVCRTFPVNCTLPDEPSNGTIVDYDSLVMNETVLEGTVLTYQCDNGLSLAAPNTITCTNAGVWSVDPEAIVCVLTNPIFVPLPTAATIAISVVVSSLLSVVFGFLAGLLVMYSLMHKKAVYSSPTEGKANVEPTAPAGPVYEEVPLQEEIDLNINQAYGPVGL